MPTTINYKDIVTGKLKKTRGRFVRWERGGPLNSIGAIVELPKSVLFIPRYLLTPDSRAALPA